MPTAISATPMVTVPAGAVYDATTDATGQTTVTFYSLGDEPAVRIRVVDEDAAAALLQGARVLATAMTEPV